MKLYFVALFLIIISGCCRYDFTVRNSMDQSVVFKAMTSSEGMREFLLQYDAEQGTLYSHQNFSTNGLTTTIRKYGLGGDIEAEWFVPTWLGAYVASAVQDQKLYLADYLHEESVDNLCVFDLSAVSRKLGEVRPLKGAMPAVVCCHGIMPLGKKQILLKLLNTETLIPSIGMFNCETGEIVKEIVLRPNGSRFVWEESLWHWCLVRVSKDRSRFLVRDENGLVLIFDQYANKMFDVTLSDLLSVPDTRARQEPTHLSKHVGIEWIDGRTVALWTDWDGRWWYFDDDTRKIVDEGNLCLRKSNGNSSAYLLRQEEIRCVLGRRRFLVKGFDEGLFSKEGYIVTVGMDGTETRERVRMGCWPVEMLTEEKYYAEEF